MPDLLAPFHQEFARLALAELALLAIAAAGVGCWIVLYGLSYAAESLSHAILPGLVAAGLLGLPLLLGGAAGALVAAGGDRRGGRGAADRPRRRHRRGGDDRVRRRRAAGAGTGDAARASPGCCSATPWRWRRATWSSPASW